MQRNLFLINSLIIFFGASYFIFSGSVILTKPFIEVIGMPFGTVITWLGLIAFQIIIYFIIKRNSIIKVSNYYRIIFKICIIIACFWGFIGYFLANNWAYNFSNSEVFRGGEKAATLFWNFTFFLLIFPIAIVLIYGVQSFLLLFKKKQR